MKIPVIVALYHFLRFIPVTGFHNALKCLRVALGGSAVRIGVKGIHTEIVVRGDSDDYHAFYTVFCKKDYPQITREKPAFVIDLGANVGFSTVLFANRYPDTPVIAVEPDPENFQQLVENTKAYRQITCLRKAVWGETGKTLDIQGTSSIGFQCSESTPRHATPGNRVDSVTIDELLAQLPTRNVKGIVKMDIEGAEKQIFATSGRWLDSVALLYLEVHSGCWKGVFAGLGARDYDCRICGENLAVTFL